jgi:dCTP deaminase
VILTGAEIEHEVERSRIVIDPFHAGSIEPNSYGFSLSPHLIVYDDEVLDARRAPTARSIEMPEKGFVLEPATLYLGSTVERLGSSHYAATLYARRSVSTMGMWIQYSAPLGHMGAIISWTLEIRVAHPVVVYPNMLIGKIAFWATAGQSCPYRGRYRGSITTVASRLAAKDGEGDWS